VAEIFVSYTSSDRDWAHWIATELRALGHVSHVHEWEIGPEDVPLAWMEERFEAADQILCVVSEEYLKAPYSKLERDAAIWHAARQSGAAIFVVVKPCPLPRLYAHLRRCELFNLPEDEARDRLHRLVTPPVPPTHVPFPGAAAPRPAPPRAPFPGTAAPIAESNISITIPRFFLGREDAMADIDAALSPSGGRAAIIALKGMRGVGKTVLAAVYAERHRRDYRATWWLRAETTDTLRADLAALAFRLGWVAPDAAQDAAEQESGRRLRAEGEGILLIFDNAPDAASIVGFLPRGETAARVLITSNAHAWSGVASSVEIRVWPPDIGADFLCQRANRPNDREAAEALSETLGGLPLAHEMAAAYCEELGLSLSAYGERFAATPAEVMDDPDSAPADYHDRMTVAKTFGLAIDAAARRHPAAEPLLVAAALLPPEPIPLFLFDEGREKLAEGLGPLLEGRGRERAVAALRRFGLVDLETIEDERDPEAKTETLRLHRLIRLAAGWRRDSAASELIREGLIEALASVYPADVFNNPVQWPRARRLDAVVLGLLGERSEDLDIAANSRAVLLQRLGAYRYARGAYSAARPLFERAVAIREKVLGGEHRDTVTSLSYLALLFRDQGDLAAARPLLERALAISEKVLGAEHPETAASLNNLALVLYDQGDLAAARPLFGRDLAISEKVLGAEHPHTATTLNNLAGLLQAQGDLAAARPLFERALAIREKVPGADHPDTATSLANLAGLLHAQGDLAAARPLFQRALAIREKVLGAEHPDTAQSLNNLALLLQDQGDLATARPLLAHALAICEKALGAEHPTTRIVRGNLSRLE
jgi:tetratricopeptide (TPR) repeat protein